MNFTKSYRDPVKQNHLTLLCLSSISNSKQEHLNTHRGRQLNQSQAISGWDKISRKCSRNLQEITLKNQKV